LEHHFSDYAVTPDTMVLNAYVAARTRRIRLGNAVIVAPWHNPIRLAEQVAMVDQLSNGRAYPGLGRGSAIAEHVNLGVDPESTRARFGEAVEVIRLALSGEEFSYEGQFHTYREIRLVPEPVQAQIPIAGAASAPPTAELIGSLGLNLLMGNPGTPVVELLAAVRAWRDATERAGRDLFGSEAIYNGLTWVADTDAEAYRELMERIPGFLAAGYRHYDVANNPWKGVKGYEFMAAAAEQVGAILAGGGGEAAQEAGLRMFCDMCFVGSPETVARRIRSFVDAGFNHIAFQCDLAGVNPIERELGIHERVAREVLPLVSEVDGWYESEDAARAMAETVGGFSS